MIYIHLISAKNLPYNRQHHGKGRK